MEGFGSYITERSQTKRRHDRDVQDTEWEGTHRRRTVLQVSWEPLLSAGTWYEVNQGKVETGYQEAFCLSKNNQQVEQPASQCSTVVNAKTVNSFKNVYDRNYRNDMDVRSRWGCWFIILQVQDNLSAFYELDSIVALAREISTFRPFYRQMRLLVTWHADKWKYICIGVVKWTLTLRWS